MCLLFLIVVGLFVKRVIMVRVMVILGILFMLILIVCKCFILKVFLDGLVIVILFFVYDILYFIFLSIFVNFIFFFGIYYKKNKKRMSLDFLKYVIYNFELINFVYELRKLLNFLFYII